MDSTAETSVGEGGYENPWTYQNTTFTSTDIDNFFGFVYCITNVTNNREYIGRKYFWQFRTPKGKKRKVKSESDWKKYYGSCPELKKKLEDWGEKILVELSYHYIIQRAKQTSKRPDNSLPTECLQNNLTMAHQSTIIVTSSPDTLEKITSDEIEPVAQIRQWAMERLEAAETVGAKDAIYKEFEDWIELEDKEEIEYICLEDIDVK